MNKEQGIAETKFRLAKGVFTVLYEQGRITKDELQILLHYSVEKYRPMIGELEVNSMPEKKVTRVELTQPNEAQKKQPPKSELLLMLVCPPLRMHRKIV